MALFKSTIFSQITNALAGLVFFSGRYGGIIGRSKGFPVNPSSNAQETVRTYFTAAVKDWQGMTDEQRTDWDNYADNTPWKNAQGDDVSLTGQAMYIAQVTAFRSAFPAGSYVSYLTAPCVGGLFPTPHVAIGCCADPDVGIKVTVTNQDSTNVMHAIVRISTPQNPSKNYFTGPYKGENAIVLTDINAGSSDEAEFCDLCPARYFIEVRGFDGTIINRFSSLVRFHADACTDPP